jgi:hypothetical protein
MYWYAVLPFHNLVFVGMLRGIARASKTGIVEGPIPILPDRKRRKK